MSPKELAILEAVREKDGLGVKQLIHVVDIAGPHLRYICNSMCRDGYLKRKNQEEYHVTWKGIEAIMRLYLEI